MKQVNSTERNFVTKKLSDVNHLEPPTHFAKQKTRDNVSPRLDDELLDNLEVKKTESNLQRGKFLLGTKKLIGDSMADVDQLGRLEKIALEG